MILNKIKSIFWKIYSLGSNEYKKTITGHLVFGDYCLLILQNLEDF